MRIKALLVACLLAACTPNEVVHDTTVKVLRPPEEIMVCPDRPTIPDPAKSTQRDVAALLLGYQDAWSTCRTSSDSTKKWLDEAEKTLTNGNPKGQN